ncbi:hypothetical protein DKP78_22425, partial [Enterococcus faecium]
YTFPEFLVGLLGQADRKGATTQINDGLTRNLPAWEVRPDETGVHNHWDGSLLAAYPQETRLN